jgi:hypothetical protein
VLQGCYKGVTKVLQGYYKGVTRVSQECYKGVTNTHLDVKDSALDAALAHVAHHIHRSLLPEPARRAQTLA